MNRTQRTLLVAAALTGIVTGSLISSGCASLECKAGASAPGGDMGKHDCQGKNSCKGQGGCGADKGKNSCKGQGGCNTNGSCKAA